MNRKIVKRTTFSFIHGIAILIGLVLVNKTPYSTDFDQMILSKISFLEDVLFPKQLPNLHNYVFINTDKDIVLMADPNDYGKIVITDRTQLATFFKMLADFGNQHQFVLCDIFFEFPTNLDTDNEMTHQISRCRNVVFASAIKDGKLINPCVDVPSAISNYETFTGDFTKMKLLYNDSLKTIPAYLYGKIDHKIFKSGFRSLNSISPRYFVRPYQLKNGLLPYFNIGEVTRWSQDSSFYSEVLKGKFIVVGNFNSDLQNTPADKMPGPLILLNTYLTLKKEGNIFSWKWVFFMTMAFSILSYFFLYSEISPPKLPLPIWFNFLIKNVLNDLFSYFTICLVILLISEFFFGKRIIISPLLVYLLYGSWTRKFFKSVKFRKT